MKLLRSSEFRANRGGLAERRNTPCWKGSRCHRSGAIERVLLLHAYTGHAVVATALLGEQER